MKRSLFVLCLGILAGHACDRTRSSTGWDYMPDMYYSNAYETYAPNPNFSDSMTLRLPAEGSIPMGAKPFGYEKTDEDRLRAGDELHNPLEASEENLALGREAFDRFCSDCHGVRGDGQGHLYTSGRYPYPPASLLAERAMALREGEIYHSISVGFGIMGPHGSMIPSRERWAIVLHVRETLQQTQN
ncbi:MAG: cytochrome c [Bacteroidales bacterium]